MHFDFYCSKDKNAQIFNNTKYSENKFINKANIQDEFYILYL